MKRGYSLRSVLLACLVAVGASSCSCSGESRPEREQARIGVHGSPGSRAASLPRKDMPRLPLRHGGTDLLTTIDARYREAVPAAALEFLETPHVVGPATHGQPSGTRRAERLAHVLEAAEHELGLDRETVADVSSIMSRFDVYRHALRQSERRGATGRDQAQASLAVLLRERNFMLRDYLGRERARRLFQLERAERGRQM